MTQHPDERVPSGKVSTIYSHFSQADAENRVTSDDLRPTADSQEGDNMLLDQSPFNATFK